MLSYVRDDKMVYYVDYGGKDIYSGVMRMRG